MKRLRKKHIVLIGLLALLVFREVGPFGLSAYTSRSEVFSSFDVAGAQVYDRVQHIAYEDDGRDQPAPKAPPDGVVIRESFFYTVDWTSWIPFYKFGSVDAVRVFIAFSEKGTVVARGTTTYKGKLAVKGLCSHRQYVELALKSEKQGFEKSLRQKLEYERGQNSKPET